MDLENLARRIRTGDSDALRELIVQYGGRIYDKAYDVTRDAELSRQVTRRTFSEAVLLLQQDTAYSGWELWLDTLADKNLKTYCLIRNDIDRIEKQLDEDLFFGTSAHTPPPEPQMPPRPSKVVPPVQERAASQSSPAANPSYPVEAAPRAKSLGWFGILCLVLFSLLIVWVWTGIAMRLAWIPRFNFGYEWFNQHIFPLF